MTNKFETLYRSYTTIELLKIVKRPDDYQPEAVATALKILEQREVNDQDHLSAEAHFAEIAAAENEKQAKIDLAKKEVGSWFEIFQPGTEIRADNWVKGFLLLVVVESLWSMYKAGKSWYFFMACKSCRLEPAVVLQGLTFFYLPLVIFLLYRRQKWGWILLFFDNIFSGLSAIVSLILFFYYYLSFQSGNPQQILWQISLHIAIVYFLWRQDIAEYFRVNIEVKKKSLIMSLAFSLVLVLTTAFIARYF